MAHTGEGAGGIPRIDEPTQAQQGSEACSEGLEHRGAPQPDDPMPQPGSDPAISAKG